MLDIEDKSNTNYPELFKKKKYENKSNKVIKNQEIASVYA